MATSTKITYKSFNESFLNVNNTNHCEHTQQDTIIGTRTIYTCTTSWLRAEAPKQSVSRKKDASCIALSTSDGIFKPWIVTTVHLTSGTENWIDLRSTKWSSFPFEQAENKNYPHPMPCKKVLSGKRVTISSIIVHTIPIHLIRLTREERTCFFIKAVKKAWERHKSQQAVLY